MTRSKGSPRRWPKRVAATVIGSDPSKGSHWGCPACRTPLQPPASHMDHTDTGWTAWYRCPTCHRAVWLTIAPDLKTITMVEDNR